MDLEEDFREPTPATVERREPLYSTDFPAYPSEGYTSGYEEGANRQISPAPAPLLG